MLNIVTVIAAALMATQSIHSPGRPLAGQPAKPSAAMSGPYQKLFRVDPPKASGPIQVRVAEPRLGRVIEMGPRFERGGCNMPIIVARPEVDPKMIVTPPESVKNAAKIRAIEPPLPCGMR